MRAVVLKKYAHRFVAHPAAHVHRRLPDPLRKALQLLKVSDLACARTGDVQGIGSAGAERFGVA
jgi:hypothetical protein